MRIRSFAAALLALPLALSGCKSSGTPTASSSPNPSATPWLMYAPGSAPPSVAPPSSGSPAPILPSISFLPAAPGCPRAWPDYDGMVLIPLLVTPLAGAVRVEWPNRYGPTYRVAAVDQELVSGAQTEPAWTIVTDPAGCTASVTLTGLKPRHPYVVWLDAPDTPRRADGSRSLYSGRSGVIDTL
jgi:hypothetical protein